MANVKNDRNKKLRNTLGMIIFILLLFYFFYTFYYGNNDNSSVEEGQTLSIGQNAEVHENQNEIQNETQNYIDGELTLVMIDVGQADCFLLKQGDMTALVDCGTRSTGKDAVMYLNNMGIKRLDYVFGTHPHDDHMGGMYDIITNFEIGKIIIPEVQEDITTNWYIKLMTEIANGDYSVEHPKVGNIYNLGDATMKVIGPISEANGNKNNYSTILKVTFGQMDIIMTGDAEKEVEKDILASGENIDAEILKLGHHGSDTSSCEEFLDNVSPDYGLISCGIGNKYKHPIKSTMDNLQKREITVYRTDENGNVIATITPTDVEFSTMPGDYLSGEEVEMMEGK